MLSSPGALLFDSFFSARSYTSFVKYSLVGVLGFLLYSSMNPSVSCHGYCLTRHVHFGGWSVGYIQTSTVGLKIFLCCMCISCAISSRCVSMSLLLFLIQSMLCMFCPLKRVLHMFTCRKRGPMQPCNKQLGVLNDSLKWLECNWKGKIDHHIYKVLWQSCFLVTKITHGWICL